MSIYIIAGIQTCELLLACLKRKEKKFVYFVAVVVLTVVVLLCVESLL